MSELREKIKSRGHWAVSIKPSGPGEPDEQLASLAVLVPSLSVQLRGWDFPHIDTNNPIARGLDWVGQESQYSHHLEAWRLHTNGLFVFMGGLPIDWRDESSWWPADETWKPGERLGVGDTVFSVTEFVEFASRLSTSAVGSESIEVSIVLQGVKGRLLYVDSPRRAGFYTEYRAGLEAIPVAKTIERTHLVADSRVIAAEVSRRIFETFGWDAPIENLLDQQRELRGFGAS